MHTTRGSSDDVAAIAHLAISALSSGVLVGRANRIIAANDAALELLGLSFEQVTTGAFHQSGWRAIRFDGTPWGVEDLPGFETLRTSEPVDEVQAGFIHPDGSLRWVTISSRPITFPDGERGTVVTMSDANLLQHSIELQTSLFDFDAVPTVIVSPDDGLMLQVNERLCSWLGYSSEELVGRPVRDLVHPDDRQKGTAARQSAAAGGQLSQVEVRYLHRDGSIRWGVGTARRLSVAGAPSGALLMQALDVTEERRVAEELQRSEQRFRSTVEAMREPVVLMDSVRNSLGEIVDFRYAYVNSAADRLIGAPAGTIIGSTLREMFPSVAASGGIERYAEVVETGRPLVYEVPWFEEGNVAGAFESSSVKLGDGFVTVAHDVTSRNLTAQRLAESERQYRRLADTAGGVIMQARGRIAEWIAPSITTLLGWDADDFVGTDLTAIVHPDDRSLLFDRPGPDNGRESTRVRFRARKRDGSWLWVERSSRVLRDEHGDLTGSTVSTLWDVQAEVEALEQEQHERQELEARVQQAARLESIGVLAGGVAHDFNNLLVAILGNTEMVLSDLPSDSPLRSMLQDVSSAAQRAATLTKQMLAYARQQPITEQSVDLGALVGETIALLRSMVPESARLLFELDPTLPAVLGDRGQLGQVLTNLVINAAEALDRRHGTVEIRTRAHTCTPDELRRLWPSGNGIEARHALLEVTDTGHGIDQDTLRHLFEPFFTTRFPGRGLGLAAVHGIVAAHGGAIDVSSTLGLGTRFAVHLPLAQQ